MQRAILGAIGQAFGDASVTAAVDEQHAPW